MRASLSLISCLCVTTALGGPPGIIIDSNDLAKVVRLEVRFLDGDMAAANSKESAESITAVLNYLQGFGYCATLTQEVTKTAAPFVLPQENFSALQTVRVVDKYITDHPERMNDPPGVIVWNALVKAFPNKDFKRSDH